MMRIRRMVLLMIALFVLMGAYAGADEINTFLDGRSNPSLNACAGGEFVYWLREDINMPWDNPPSLYRMRPGDEKAELLLEGSDDFWMWSWRKASPGGSSREQVLFKRQFHCGLPAGTLYLKPTSPADY